MGAEDLLFVCQLKQGGIKGVCVLGTATFSNGDAHGVRGAARLRSCEREKRLMMVIGDMREK